MTLTPDRPPFGLYPAERHWWSFNDYGLVVAVTRHLGARLILEFGPGSSTLSLLEGGALRIDACEDDPAWAQTYRKDFALFPVRFHEYTWADPVTVPGLHDLRYDLALVDGPHRTENRPAVIDFALTRAGAVLVPIEDDDRPGRGYLQPHIVTLAAKHGRLVEWFRTGPIAGGFALLTEATL